MYLEKVLAIDNNKKDGGMSVLPWSFAKSKYLMFKNSHI